MARRGNKKSYDGWHQRHVNDLRHMLNATSCGRLPRDNHEYIAGILLKPNNLPKPREIAMRVHFTNEQRERHKLWTIPPVDMSKAQLKVQRREKDKKRKALARRRHAMRTYGHYQTREQYLAQFAHSAEKTEPWKAFGWSRAKWYRRGKPKPPSDVRQGSSAHITSKSGHTLSHLNQASPPKGHQGVPSSGLCHISDTGMEMRH
jgi:hypothetical protein